MKRHIPNAITILNLLCGYMACHMALNGDAGGLRVAAYFIAAGAFFDLLDGMVARALGVSHPLGKQLDSLADMVSFGLAPAFIAYQLIRIGIQHDTDNIAMTWGHTLLTLAPMVLVACSALRLAKFNIDEEQSVDFLGLPTPANALFWLSIPLSTEVGLRAEGWLQYLQSPSALAVLCVLLGLLLVSRIPLFSLKLDGSDRSRQRWQIMLAMGALLCFGFFRFAGLPMVIVLYLLLSLIRNSIDRP